jgi:hypothetical protein
MSNSMEVMLIIKTLSYNRLSDSTI